jgi:hypothetical protein
LSTRIETSKRQIYDILKDISNIKNKDERAQAVRIACKRIGTIAKLLQLVYHKNFNLDLPDKTIPDNLWKRSSHDEFGILYNIINRRKLFNISKESGVASPRKESIFIDILESVGRKDADLILAILAKELPFKNLNEKFIKETLPELFFAEEQEKKTKSK